MDGDDGVAGIVFAGEERAGFNALKDLAEGIDFAAEVGSDVFAFATEIKIGLDIFGALSKVGCGGENAFEPFLLPHNLLGAGRVRPQVGVGGLLFDFV